MEKSAILEILKKVSHPELKADIVSAGIVKDINISGEKILVKLHFLKPVDPFANNIKRNVISVLKGELKDNYEIDVENTFPETELKERAAFQGVKNIIAIASGKGGVGKSTVAANLAVALSLQGYKTGLLDADVFGPSVPKMFGVEDAKPTATEDNLIIPVEKYGVKILSSGFFVDPAQAIIWRGPMATGALKQLMSSANWEGLDIVLIDLPPGTSDIHLTMVQTVGITGAIIITTPQEIAMVDVLKAVSMFRTQTINVPILGIVENMSWFTPAELPNNKYYIFGKGGGEKLASQLNIKLLGQIPIVQSICESGDSGAPAALNPESATGKAFHELAGAVLVSLAERNKLEPTKKVKITN